MPQSLAELTEKETDLYKEELSWCSCQVELAYQQRAPVAQLDRVLDYESIPRGLLKSLKKR